MLDLTPIILLVSFLLGLVIVLLALGVARYVKNNPEEEEFTKSLEELRRGDTQEDTTKVARQGWFAYWNSKFIKTGRLTDDPNQAGKLALGLMAVSAGVGIFIWPGGIIGGLVFGGGAIGIMLLVFNAESNKRSKTLEKQLPLLLSSLRAQIQSTATPAKAIMAVADDLPAPIGDELKMVKNDLNVNVPLSQALQSLVKRVNSREIKFLAASIETAVEAGQDVDEQLKVIEEIVIQRQKIAQSIQTAVSQVSTSLWVSGFIIPASFLFSYYQGEANRDFWVSFNGLIAFGVIVGLYILGLFISFRLVKSVEKV